MADLALEAYSQAIRVHFPNLPIRSFAFFKEGWGNRLILVNDTIVFRFPMDSHGANQILGEIRLLHVLAPFLPLPVPNYQYVAPASHAYPYPFGATTSYLARPIPGHLKHCVRLYGGARRLGSS